jgi:hypothetical protein
MSDIDAYWRRDSLVNRLSRVATILSCSAVPTFFVGLWGLGQDFGGSNRPEGSGSSATDLPWFGVLAVGCLAMIVAALILGLLAINIRPVGSRAGNLPTLVVLGLVVFVGPFIAFLFIPRY